MLCEKCNSREAEIHYTEIVNGVRNEHHLCSECASQMDLSYYSNVLGAEFPFAKLLSGLFAAGKAVGKANGSAISHVVCPQCGMNFEEFIKVGKFGCAECYSVFGPLIDENMKKIHGSNTHTGKKYGDAENSAGAAEEASCKEDGVIGQVEDLLLLKAKLKEAVELENYEDAAELRDKIHMIEKQTGFKRI